MRDIAVTVDIIAVERAMEGLVMAVPFRFVVASPNRRDVGIVTCGYQCTNARSDTRLEVPFG